MSTSARAGSIGGLTIERIRATEPHRHILLPRAVAGLPLLAVGLAHVFVPDASMRALVEAAGLPLAAVLSPFAVGVELVAAVSLLLGFWARIGGVLAMVTMLMALYAHLVIDVWPNGVDNEPPLALPIVIILCAGYVVWRGAGRWSLDRRGSQT